MEKRDAAKYSLVIMIILSLVVVLVFLKGDFTGFAVFEDFIQGDFDNGTYLNTEWNGSAVVLAGENLTGNYTSQIFDASNDAIWNNLSWISQEPDLEYLYCVDGGGDVYKSSDYGVNWVISQEDYGRTSVGQDMFSDSDYLYILAGSTYEVWRSSNGTDFAVINDTFTNKALLVGDVDSDENLYVATGPGEVWRSSDNGITWTYLSDFNDGIQDPKGIAINSSDGIFTVDGTGDVYSSVDSGISWIKVNEGYGGSTGTDGMDTDSNDDLYILLNTELYKSTDSGATWTVINDSISPYANTLVEILIDDSDNIYILDAIGRVFKSNDYGVSWVEIGDCNNDANNDPIGFTSFSQATSLDFQVKSCDDAVCSGESWTNITDTSPQDLSLDDNRYFQYKIDFTSPDSSITPSLESISIDYSLVNTAPIINIAEPQDGTTYGYNESLNLNFSVIDADDNIDSCWYSIDSGVTNVTIDNCVNTTFDIAEGSHTLNIYINDSLGLESSDSVGFSVQVGAPGINLHCPVGEYLNYQENIYFNYTPTDIDLDYCELWGNFGGEFKLNQTDTSPTSGSVNNFVLNLSDGSYLWNIRCVDDLSNSAFNGNKTFYVDTTNPSLSLTEPTGSKTSRTVSASWNVSDASSINCIYNVYQGASAEIINTSIDCSDNSASFDVSADADFIFNFYVNDSAGNSAFSNLSFSVDTIVAPPVNPGGSSGGGGGGSVISNVTKKGRFSVFELGNIIANSGDKKTLSLTVKNTGGVFLNKCRLNVKGDIDSWIYSTQLEGIAPGENIDFVFDLNVPEEISSGEYVGELEISCNEGISSQELIVSIPGSLNMIQVQDITYEKDELIINYNFDTSKVIGNSVGIDIWVLDENENEINRIQDGFTLVDEEFIERQVLIELDKNLVGIYYVYFALSNDLDNFVKQSVVLGEGRTTGLFIWGATNGKMIGYILFLLIVVVGVFFIMRRHGKHGEKTHNKWLLRKKGRFGFVKIKKK